MKKLSCVAVLALSTMLTACSGGGSGGGTSFVPVTSLPDGSTVPESGTSIQMVNNTKRRTENYENAVTALGSTASGIAEVSTKTASNTSAQEINKAYRKMNKILVSQNFSNATKEDILLSLAMAGEDISSLKDKSLDEIKTAAQSSAIQSKAEDVYARLGTVRNLSLKDITFYDVDEGTWQGGSKYTFIVDKNGNLTGLKEVDFEGSVLKFNKIGKGKYKNNEGFVDYGFMYRFESGKRFEEVVTLSKSENTEENVKNELKKIAETLYEKSSITAKEIAEILAWIDDFDMENVRNIEEGEYYYEICDENCIFSEHIADTVEVKLSTLGKDVGLKYSDFGSVNYKIQGGTLGGENNVSLFYGGYKTLSATASDLPQVDTEMNFEGKALANVWAEHKDSDIDTSKLYNGTADLTFKDGKETLVADFTDWHKVTLETNKSAYTGYDVTIEGTPKDATYALENPNPYPLVGADIKYYGENPKNPDEVVGTAYFVGDNDTHWVDAEMVFGATRK